MKMSCPENYGGSKDCSKCKVDWGTNSSKVLVLATDEDSDLPTNEKCKMFSQSNKVGCTFLYDKNGKPKNNNWMIEPLFYPSKLLPLSGVKDTMTYYRTGSGMTLDTGFQLEIDHTAKLLSKSDVILVSLISQRPGSEDPYYRDFVRISAFNSEDSKYFSQNSNNTSFVSIISSGIIGVGVISALLFRKRNSETETFNLQVNTLDGAAVSNPLYHAFMSGENPFYERQSENLNVF